MRNLFAEWPRDHLAQIYSGGHNGDEGFCGHSYQLAANDRRLGALFLRLKSDYTSANAPLRTADAFARRRATRWSTLRNNAGRFLLDSGIYELIFRLQLSQALCHWVEEFKPDVIFAQGYNLSFASLPMLLKSRFGMPVAFFTSDDWPTYVYAETRGLLQYTAPYMRHCVTRATRRLLSMTDIPLSFNDMMSTEYAQRYQKHFTAVMHSDDPARFARAEPRRLQPAGVYSIVTTGSFFIAQRWQLLLDVEESLRRLNEDGIPVRLTALTSTFPAEALERLQQCRYITLQDDPGHELLPSYLKGADLLLLSEVFDEAIAHGYRLSVSTKAHLFMFSQTPILVYGHAHTGVVSYARSAGWATVVETRDIARLTAALRQALLDAGLRHTLVDTASSVARRNHDGVATRAAFRALLTRT